jgi:predicted permease
LIASVIPAGNFDRVFVLQLTEPVRQSITTRSLTLPTVHELEKDLPTNIDSIAAVCFQETATLTAPGYAENVLVEAVTSGYGRVFDLHTSQGRWFEPLDDTPPHGNRVAIISDRIWHEWFHGDPAVAAHATIQVNHLHYAVVGVAAAGFRGVIPGLLRADVWIPSATLGDLYPQRALALAEWHDKIPETVFVRTRAGASPIELRDRLRPYMLEGWDGHKVPAALSVLPAMDALAAPYLRGRVFAVGFATLVLLAACANFANLLLARGAQRQGELAVRMSLGANPLRIFRLLVIESAVVGLAAAFTGLLVAMAAAAAFARAFPTIAFDRAHLLGIGIQADGRLALFAVASGLVVASSVGAFSAIAAMRFAPQRVMASGGAASGVTSRDRTRTALVAVQVTAALLLVMGAGIFLENQPPGLGLDKRVRYDAGHLLAARMDLSLNGYTPARARAVFDRVLAAASRIPGVERAALAEGVPGAVGDAAPAIRALIAQDAPDRPTGNPRRIQASAAAVSASLLDTLGIPLLRGRPFTQWDAEGATLVAIVSESTAQALYPGRDALGLPVQYGFGGEWLTIVGICADPILGASDTGVYGRPANAIFVPAAQHFSPKIQIVLRASNPKAITEPLRGVMRGVDEGVPMYTPTTLEEGFLSWWSGVRAANVAMTMLGAAALSIAILGIYGVMSYFVSLRTREFGIRLALGATRGDILKLVIEHAIRVLLIGLLCGVAVATTASRVIEQTVTRTMPNQLATWIVVPLLFVAVGVLAAYFPAKRASRVDPSVALRAF